MSPRISVAINTLNAENWLPFALRSVEWADEVIVADMRSDDRTAEIARARGARVLEVERATHVEPARALALERCSGDWVLILDADEMVPFPLSRRLRELAAGDAWDAVRIPFVNHLLGRAMRGSGWGPAQDRHVRFFRRGTIELPDRIHGALRPRPGARLHELPDEPGLAIVHFNYVDLREFVDRLNRYTTVEAADAHAAGDRPSAWRALRRGLRQVLARRGGAGDGWRGASLTAAMVFYEVLVQAKLRELRESGGAERVLAEYRRAAEEILDRHRGGER